MEKIRNSGWYTMAYLMIVVTILMVGTSSATEQSLGIFKQNTCITLKQSCANCTFVNVTSIMLPDGSLNTTNSKMTKNGTEYSLPYCTTTQLGMYTYNTLGDLDGVNTVQPVSFEITPGGTNSKMLLYIIVFLAIYGISFIGFFGKSIWVAMIGGLGMIVLGLYFMTNGIDAYRNFMTDAMSWITIAIGAIFSLTAGVELINDNL